MPPSIIQALQSLDVEVYHTGSRYICENPPEGSDDDWIINASDNPYLVASLIEAEGYESGKNAEPSGSDSDLSVYKDGVNLIVIFDPAAFKRWKQATDMAKAQGLKTREERVALFKQVVDGAKDVARKDEEIPL